MLPDAGNLEKFKELPFIFLYRHLLLIFINPGLHRQSKIKFGVNSYRSPIQILESYKLEGV